MDTKEFGRRLRAARKAAGLEQKDLAAACGKTRGAISQWESGLVADVSATALRKVARKLRVTMDFLLDGESDDTPLPPTLAELAPDWNTLTESQQVAMAAQIRDLASHNRALLAELTGR